LLYHLSHAFQLFGPSANQIAFYPFELFKILSAWRLKMFAKDMTIRTRVRYALIKAGFDCEPIHSVDALSTDKPVGDALSTDS